MRPAWLIEADVYGDEAEPLRAEIRRQGMAVAIVPYRSLRKDADVIVDGRTLGPEECVIGYGTFPFARQIQLHRRWVPGAWCTPENLDCTTYYAYFGPYLLNQQYAIMPGVEAIRQSDWLFSAFGREGVVFVRPTGAGKLFVGRCVGKEAFAIALAPTRYDPATLVAIAPPRPIDREWRLVVCGDRVIGASQYAVAGKRNIARNAPDAVLDYAASLLKAVRWRPDPIFMMDVGESDGRFWLIELNGFSTSWLYQCDVASVVCEASELAEKFFTSSPRRGDTR